MYFLKKCNFKANFFINVLLSDSLCLDLMQKHSQPSVMLALCKINTPPYLKKKKKEKKKRWQPASRCGNEVQSQPAKAAKKLE